ncbi:MULTISPECIES: FumA C-terminus/TtdB family hydratase beta subunit [Pseudothermotoga]|uniref:Hydro-lyase, Fe-S type, tartrate/fumarate subfamily, beta subunit n=1 Tax=Pseudothermotoga lettingae (strain ATCC BAA-301 / DSM 14385 / NBRC 107922 / TMO) TaxID=416591 RepID=A8F5P9_PSELT|nr:hydro-lyase, Fe-S type, tartrate/fumarate subfamily, beta subunit [Pseudothermotoga lettingae TMO]HBJ80442.1 TRZ/ATZ family protein [Pseudothermotoga sp.]HBT26050.1 TRZ/ATZ family protein [Pseudothermotoga sp.]
MNLVKLNVGERIDYSGEFLIMRDAAQKRIKMMIDHGEQPLIDLSGKIVFYAGPTNPKNNRRAIGPTTSERMDNYLEILYKLGVIATVGKGKRGKVARELCKKYNRVYFITPSGAAAALSTHIEDIRLIAFDDLGPEGIYVAKVVNFPLIVAIDSLGNDLFL